MTRLRVPRTLALSVGAAMLVLGAGRVARAQIPGTMGAGIEEPDETLAGGRYRSPRRFAVEVRFGPYRPDIDSEFNGSRSPYQDYFGSGSHLISQLEFDYEFYDRYNWDTGKQVTIPPNTDWGVTITDQFMGDFHRMGLAREFDMTASVHRRFSWRRGQFIPHDQLYPPGGR